MLQKVIDGIQKGPSRFFKNDLRGEVVEERIAAVENAIDTLDEALTDIGTAIYSEKACDEELNRVIIYMDDLKKKVKGLAKHCRKML